LERALGEEWGHGSGHVSGIIVGIQGELLGWAAGLMARGCKFFEVIEMNHSRLKVIACGLILVFAGRATLCLAGDRGTEEKRQARKVEMQQAARKLLAPSERSVEAMTTYNSHENEMREVVRILKRIKDASTDEEVNAELAQLKASIQRLADQGVAISQLASREPRRAHPAKMRSTQAVGNPQPTDSELPTGKAPRLHSSLEKMLRDLSDVLSSSPGLAQMKASNLLLVLEKRASGFDGGISREIKTGTIGPWSSRVVRIQGVNNSSVDTSQIGVQKKLPNPSATRIYQEVGNQ